MMPVPPFVDFVEDKSITAELLTDILRPAVAANRHTNFGPVSETLETLLGQLNGNNPDRAACAVTNATLGLQAAVAVFDNTCGKRLRWAVSDFGFFTSFTGPFHDQHLVPCGADGMLDPGALAALPQDSYDAILATNIFGLHEDFDALFEFAARHDKVLLIDNAAGFGALAPYHASPPPGLIWAEAVSFHHTKPWGMGEGGALFLATDLKATARAVINFGVGGGQRLADPRFCTNGKLSEIAAAQILARVRDRDAWIPAYRQQAARLMDLGRAVGLKPLVDPLPAQAAPGQIAFLCDHPVALEQLENRLFRILKYYRPAPQSGPRARQLFDCILNLPCHAGMKALSDAAILDVLTSVQGPR